MDDFEGIAEREDFGWTDLAHAHPMELARRFVKSFDEVAREGKGDDGSYVGWYVWMMHLCWPGNFPIAYADWPMERGVLSTIGPVEIIVPLSPPRRSRGSEGRGIVRQPGYLRANRLPPRADPRGSAREAS